MAKIPQSGLDSGLGVQIKSPEFWIFPPLRLATTNSGRLKQKAMISVQEQLLRRNVKRFRGVLTKANRHVYHSTPGSREIKKKRSIAVPLQNAHKTSFKVRRCYK